MNPRHQVESFKFWDIVTLWAKEELESEEIVARALAKGVVRDGLRLNSTDLRWVKGKALALALNGQPYVGFCAKPGVELCVLRAEALEHLLAVVREAKNSFSVMTFAAGCVPPSSLCQRSGSPGVTVPSNSAPHRDGRGAAHFGQQSRARPVGVNVRAHYPMTGILAIIWPECGSRYSWLPRPSKTCAD